MKKNILLVGGSGVIGNQIRSIINSKFPNISIFKGSRSRNVDDYLQIDINDSKTFDIIKNKSIDIVVLCTTDQNNDLLKFCIKQNVDYMDITKPTSDMASAYELAKNKDLNSRVVFSSGWMGGIIPSLVSDNINISSINRIKIYIYYSLKDKAGKSSADFMAENISKPFHIIENDELKTVRLFEDDEKYTFIFNSQKYSLYNFDIPDIYILNQKIKIPSVSAKITYSSPLVTKALALAQKANIFKRLSLNTRKKIFYSSGEGDITTFEIVSELNNGTESQISLVCKNGQAYLTALSASTHIEKLLSSELPKEVYFSYQLYRKNELTNILKENKQIKIEAKLSNVK